MKIEIIMTLENDSILLNHEINLPYSKRDYDSVTIHEKCITLTGKRNKSVDIDNYNAIYRSSIYLQIMKLILFAYISCKKIVTIRTIQIIQGHDSHTLESDQFGIKNEIDIAIFELLDLEKYKKSLEQFDKSEVYIRSIFYYMEAQSNTSPHAKFEKYWKSFNILYVFHSKQKEDFKGLVKIREYIKTHPSKYVNTIRLVNNLSEYDLRNNFRWRNMILNDFENESKTKSYKDFILRYSDYRVMKLMKELSCYRNDFLRNKGLYNIVHDHINNSIENQNVDDTELISLLIIKYSYFLRNKYFHGEYNENFYNLFRFGKNDDEFLEINNIFDSFLGETINSFDTL